MGYVVRYSTSNINKTRRKGNAVIGVDSGGYSKTSESGFYAGVPPVAGKHNVVRVQSSGDPDFYVLDDSELINLANQLGGSVSTTTAATTYLAGRDDIIFTDNVVKNTVTDGLVLDLNANNISSYPKDGTTWYDLSGNGYNATLYNSPSFLNGKFVLDNADDYILASFNEGVLKQTNQSGTWTIETSFIYNGNSSNNEAIIAGRSGHHGGIYMYNNDILRHAVKTDQGWTGAINTAIATLQDGKGYHTVMTYNNGIVKSYLNGEYVSTSTLDLNTYDMRSYDNTFYIGGISNRYNNISLETVKCYTNELSQTEVHQNYYGGNIVTDGLTLSIDPSNLVSYEKDNTLVYNLTGSISGSVINSLTTLTQNGGVFDFDGADDLIRLGNQPSMLTDDITQEAWVNTDTMVNWHGIISNMDGWGTGFSLQIGPTQNIAAMVSGNYLKTSWTPSIGVWYHIVATHRSSDNYNALYVNGKLENTMTRAISYDGGDVIDIGCFYTGGGLRFNGKMGPVRTYNKALSADEVLQNYNAQKARFI